MARRPWLPSRPKTRLDASASSFARRRARVRPRSRQRLDLAARAAARLSIAKADVRNAEAVDLTEVSIQLTDLAQNGPTCICGHLESPVTRKPLPVAIRGRAEHVSVHCKPGHCRTAPDASSGEGATPFGDRARVLPTEPQSTGSRPSWASLPVARTAKECQRRSTDSLNRRRTRRQRRAGPERPLHRLPRTPRRRRRASSGKSPRARRLLHGALP